jgi:hypothetical protein
LGDPLSSTLIPSGAKSRDSVTEQLEGKEGEEEQRRARRCEIWTCVPVPLGGEVGGQFLGRRDGMILLALRRCPSPPLPSDRRSVHERSVGVASLGINYTSQQAIVFSPWEWPGWTGFGLGIQPGRV